MAEKVYIRKRGYFYRPGWCGYTASHLEAGHYWRAEAEDHAKQCEGVTVHALSEYGEVTQERKDG